MNTTKKLMTVLLTLLALTACHNDDEPNSPDVNKGNIYLAVSNPSDIGDMVITAKGDTVYQCDPFTWIARFLADGRDWYAVTHQFNGNDHIIKNGNIIYTITEEERVINMCVDDGNIYTLQEPYYEPVRQEWLCKNFTHIYSLPYGQFESTQVVAHHGDVALAPSHSREACYWRNGEFIAMQGLEGSLSMGLIDTDGDDVLIGINVDKNDRTGYWRNGTYSKLDSTIIRQVKLFGGKSYILGTRYTTDVPNPYYGGAIRITSDAIIIVDGQEQVLRTGDKNNQAMSMIQYNNDNYILVKEYLQEMRGNKTETIERKSFIYKNMKPMKLGDDITKLDVIDFAIIDK